MSPPKTELVTSVPGTRPQGNGKKKHSERHAPNADKSGVKTAGFEWIPSLASVGWVGDFSERAFR